MPLSWPLKFDLGLAGPWAGLEKRKWQGNLEREIKLISRVLWTDFVDCSPAVKPRLCNCKCVDIKSHDSRVNCLGQLQVPVPLPLH